MDERQIQDNDDATTTCAGVPAHCYGTGRGVMPHGLSLYITLGSSMTQLFRSLLTKADAWSPRALLWINIALAGFVTVAHGGAVLVANAQGSPNIAETRSLASVSLPLAAFVLACSVLGLASLRWRPSALASQGAVFVFAVAPQVLLGH
jgi:hypothetical protein